MEGRDDTSQTNHVQADERELRPEYDTPTDDLRILFLSALPKVLLVRELDDFRMMVLSLIFCRWYVRVMTKLLREERARQGEAALDL